MAFATAGLTVFAAAIAAWTQTGSAADARLRGHGGGKAQAIMAAVAGFDDLAELPLQRIWDGVAARTAHGERLSLGVVELDPGAVVPEHHHEHEQLGMVISGSVRFRIADDTRELGPGETWTIPSNVPHEVTAGPEGAVVIDVFAPVRADWTALEAQEPRPPRWP